MSKLSPDAQFGGAAGNWFRYLGREVWHTIDALCKSGAADQTIFGSIVNAKHYYSEGSLQGTLNDVCRLGEDARNALWHIPGDLQKMTPDEQTKASARLAYETAFFFLGAKAAISEKAVKLMNLEEKSELELRVLGIERRTESLSEKDIFSPIDRHASTGEKISQLQTLSVENQPLVEKFLKRIDTELGTKSELDFKEPAEIENKANRPAIKETKEWFDIEHVRDAIRFRTPVDNLNELPKIVKALKESGFEIVNPDFGKLLSPKGRGWRMAAIDLRAPNGQIIEYQILPKELNDAGKIEHATFEEWRGRDSATLSREEKIARERADRDAAKFYRNAWDSYLKRTGQTEETIKRIIADATEILN
jgi:hypothetical protein